MKQSLKLIGFAIMALSLTLSSCGKDGEDGEDGAMGLQGEQGIAGIDGTNGQDGADGANGTDGEDGNANVSAFKYDITEASGISHQLNNTTPASFVEDGAVLSYVRAGDTWYYVPNQRIFTNGFALIDIGSEFVPNGNTSYYFKLNFLRDGEPIIIGAGDLDELRLVVMSPSNTGKSSKYNTLDALYEKGIDPTDYYQVMKHFNLKH